MRLCIGSLLLLMLIGASISSTEFGSTECTFLLFFIVLLQLTDSFYPLDWIDARVPPGADADGSLEHPFSTVSEAASLITANPASTDLFIINLSPGGTYRWPKHGIRAQLIVRRCEECPTLTSNVVDQTSNFSGPIVGHIADLHSITDDINTPYDFVAYLDHVQTLEYEQLPVIEICNGSRFLESCPYHNSTFGVQHVVIRSVPCASSPDPVDTTLPSRIINMNCPSSLYIDNVIVRDFALSRAFIAVLADSKAFVSNVTIISSVLTHTQHYFGREAIVSSEAKSSVAMFNVLFYNNTNQLGKYEFEHHLMGGAIVSQGTIVGANIAFMNTTLIQFVLDCGRNYVQLPGALLPPDEPPRFWRPPGPVAGGAISMMNGVLQLNRAWFIGNEVTRCVNSTLMQFVTSDSNLPSGGAIHMADAAFVELQNTNFVDNRAWIGGAISVGLYHQFFALFSVGDQLVISSSHFNFNKAILSAADIYCFSERLASIAAQNTVFANSQTSLSYSLWQESAKKIHQEHFSVVKSKNANFSSNGRLFTNFKTSSFPNSSSSQSSSLSNTTILFKAFMAMLSEQSTSFDPKPIKPTYLSNLPIGTSIAMKSQSTYVDDAYFRAVQCTWQRNRLVHSTPEQNAITSPLITAQRTTVLALYNTTISNIVSMFSPIVWATHVGTTTLLETTLYHISYTSNFSAASLFDVRYGSSASQIPDTRNLKARSQGHSSVSEASFNSKFQRDTHQTASVKAFKRSVWEDRLAQLRKFGFFDKYPSTDPLGEGKVYAKTNDPQYATNTGKRGWSKDVTVNSTLLSYAYWLDPAYKEDLFRDTPPPIPSPNSFCAIIPGEPVSVGTNDHTPELLIYGFRIYDCSSVSSVLSALYLRSVKVIDTNMTLDIQGNTKMTRKPWDYLMYFSDIYGYIFFDRSLIWNSVLPIIMIRSNNIEISNGSLVRPIGSPITTKPALIIRDSSTLFFHHYMIIGYKTVSRLSPVVIEQVVDSVYLQKVSFIGNEAAQNGGALAIVARGVPINNFAAVIEDCSFTHNLASSGGAIYSYGALLVTRSSFIGNSAKNGGAISAAFRSICIYNSTFVDNLATNQGGCIISQAVTTGIVNTDFLRCAAQTAGGGIASSVGNMAVLLSNFTACHAPDGGAIATLEFDGGKGVMAKMKRVVPGSHRGIEGLQMATGFSTAWKTREWLLLLSSSNFERNYAHDGTFTTQSPPPFETFPWPTTFSTPKSNRGGAVFTCQFTRVTVYGLNFIENWARTGGALFILGVPQLLSAAGSNFTNNMAYYAGGAIASYALTDLDEEAVYTSPGSPLRPPSSHHIYSDLTFCSNRAVFGGAIWMTPGGSENTHIENCTWIENYAHWGAVMYFSGDESSIPTVKSSQLAKNAAKHVGPTMFFNGPPATNATSLISFCNIENGCQESGGTSGSSWGQNGNGTTHGSSATSGYSIQFTLNFWSGANATYGSSMFNLSKTLMAPDAPGLTEQTGNCFLVDPIHPFFCYRDPSAQHSSTTPYDKNCDRPAELHLMPGNISVSITLLDGLGQVVDDNNNYATCLRLVENPHEHVGALWKPSTVTYGSNTIFFSLAFPSNLTIREESLYIPDTPQFTPRAVMVLGVESVSTGSSAVSAIEPNRFANVPLTLIPIRLSGCPPGYGLQQLSSDEQWAVCDVCPEGTYNFDGDGFCWLCADPSLPYSLVSCSYQYVRPMLGVYVAQANKNTFATFICPYGFCSNCTAESYSHAYPSDSNRANSKYWRKNVNSVKRSFSALFDFVLGIDSSIDTYFGTGYRRNAMGNYDWIIDELEAEEVASSSFIPQSRFSVDMSEDNDFNHASPSNIDTPLAHSCPFGDCVIGRDPSSPLCGKCAPGYHESLGFDICSKNLCKTPQVGAMIGVAVFVALVAVLLHELFYRYPAKISISIFFLQALPLLRVDILAPLVENDTFRNLFCLIRVRSSLPRILFFQFTPLYFATVILTIFTIHRVIYYGMRCFGLCRTPEETKLKNEKMRRLQRNIQSSTGYDYRSLSASSDEEPNTIGVSSASGTLGEPHLRDLSLGSDTSVERSTASNEEDIPTLLDSSDAFSGSSMKTPRHITDWDQRETEPFFATSRLCRSLLALVMLSVIPNMRLFADLFHCVEIPGFSGTLWYHAPTIMCQTASFRILKGVSIPIISLLILGLIALYARTMSVFKKRIVDGLLIPHTSFDTAWLRNCAYFYESYRATRYFWFALHLAERMLLPLCVSLAWTSPGVLHFTVSVNLLISCLFQAFTWSYLDPWDNLASCFSLALLTLISLLRDSAFQANIIDYASPRTAFTIFLFWLSFNLAFVVIEIVRVVSRYLQRRRNN